MLVSTTNQRSRPLADCLGFFVHQRSWYEVAVGRSRVRSVGHWVFNGVPLFNLGTVPTVRMSGQRVQPGRRGTDGGSVPVRVQPVLRTRSAGLLCSDLFPWIRSWVRVLGRVSLLHLSLTQRAAVRQSSVPAGQPNASAVGAHQSVRSVSSRRGSNLRATPFAFLNAENKQATDYVAVFCWMNCSIS